MGAESVQQLVGGRLKIGPTQGLDVLVKAEEPAGPVAGLPAARPLAGPGFRPGRGRLAPAGYPQLPVRSHREAARQNR